MVDKERAAKAIALLGAASNEIADALEVVRDWLTPDEFQSRASATGKILGALYYDLMKPLVEEHPELDPDRQ